MANYKLDAGDGETRVTNYERVSKLFHYLELRSNDNATGGTVEIQARRPGADEDQLVSVGTYDFSGPTHIDHTGPVSEWVFTVSSIVGAKLIDVTITSTETGKGDGGASDLIDDDNVSTEKAYSSSKIESKFLEDGFPNNEFVSLIDSYTKLPKGATYIYGFEKSKANLPNTDSEQMNLLRFGPIYDDSQQFDICCTLEYQGRGENAVWARVAMFGVETPWFKIGSRQYESILESITDTGSGKIITDSERNKINAITDTGSGKIITDAERTKLSALTINNEEDELEEGLLFGNLRAKSLVIG